MKRLSFAVLGIRDFRLLMGTRVFGAMALQTQAVIVGWQIYVLTHSFFMLGLVGLTEAIPAITCALVAGHIVDISRPHRVYAMCIGAMVINTFALFLIAGEVVAVPGIWMVRAIFAGVFISGIARSFVMPASFSLLPQVVGRPQIGSASALMTSSFQLASIIGPAIAGLVYGGYGSHVAWMIPMSFMSLAFILFLNISQKHRHYRGQEKREPAVKSIKAGWRFIWENQILLAIMALDMFAVLFGGAVAMLPAFADQILHIGSQGLGELRAAPAVGAIVTAVLLGGKPFKTIRGTTLLFVVTGFGFCMIGFGLSTSFWPAVIALILSGAFDSTSMIIRGTLMQLLTPDEMRGRVSAVGSMFIISSNEIGAFESGVAAKLLGLTPSIVLGGIGTLVVVAAIGTLCPKLRRLTVNTQAT